MIVDITPVAHPGGRLTSATTASGRDAGGAAAGGGGGSGGGGGLGLGLGENVSQLASQLFRFGSKKRPGVCICNAQCRLQSLGETKGSLGATTLKTHHGSLDRLLQKGDGTGTATSGERSISWVVDGGGAGSGALLNASSDESDDKKKKLDEGNQLPPPPRPPSRSHAKPTAKEEFDRGVEVEKFYHQINGDIFEITRRVRARDEETMEQKCIRRKGSVRLTEPTGHAHVRIEQRPQLPPRRQKSAEEVATMPKSALRQPPEQLEWFDRRAQQRHSARSAEGGQVREETMEWLKLQKTASPIQPVRTSSGPSEITVLKDELPDWLLDHLPRKKERERDRLPSDADKAVGSAYAKALADLLKKPLSRQGSGPCEFSLLKTDIVEWLTKMQSSSGTDRGKSRRSHHRRNGSGGDAQPRSNSQEDAQDQSKTSHRKRHSLGHSGAVSEEEQQQLTADWIAYPLHKLQSLGKQPPPAQPPERMSIPSGYAVPSALSHTPLCQRREERSRERRLRHSASEVVGSGGAGAASTSNTAHLERLYAKPHKERYQYVPKTKESSGRKERSRRHQTQRSATVSDMSAQRSGGHKRKSSSAERAPRSPSPGPCTDPDCPLLPICTDPHCRYQECQARQCITSSVSSVNLARHQQLAQVQLHAVPAHLVGAMGSDVPTTPSTTATPPPPTGGGTMGVGATGAGAGATSERRLVICHDCRSCAPLLSCRNRKCLNAAKCNSLPRCAADFNRLRTQLSQPPTTLDDIEPAPLDDLEMQPLPSPPHPHPHHHYRSNSQPNTLQRGDSASSAGMGAGVGGAGHGGLGGPGSGLAWLEPTTTLVQPLPAYVHHSNGKLMKSASAASLNSRRRRHKTVHFGENLLREVCQNRKLIKTEAQVPSGSAPMKANIQMLYNFVEGVLSAWVDDDEDQVRSGAESEPEHGVVPMQPIHRCNRLRYQCIRRVVEEAADLQGTLKLGNSRYRHRHWRSTAKQCNEMFLRKVGGADPLGDSFYFFKDF